MAEIEIFNPDSLGTPLGQYCQISRFKAQETIFIAGQVGVKKDGTILETFEEQVAQTFDNIEAALKSCGCSWANVVLFRTYLVHSQDIPKFMDYRIREFPKKFKDGKYPPNTLLMIDRLVKEPLLFEVEAVAAL